MDEFKSLAIERGVKQIFDKRHFDICLIRNLSELMDIKPNEEILDQLSMYHCVKWSKMSSREKELIQQKIIECLRGDPILNPVYVTSQLTTEGRDFTFTEDREVLSTDYKRLT